MDADAPHGRKERAHRELGKPRRTRFPTAPTASIFLPINLQEEIRCWTRAHRRLSRIRQFSTTVDIQGPLRSETRSTPEGNLSRTCAGTRAAAGCGARPGPSRWTGRYGTCGVRPFVGTPRSLPRAHPDPRTGPRPAQFASRIALERQDGTTSAGVTGRPAFSGDVAATPADGPSRFQTPSPYRVELHHVRDLSCSLLSPVLLRGPCREDDGRHSGPRNPFAHDGGDRRQGHAA